MALGDNQMNVLSGLSAMFSQHKISVQLVPSKADEAVARDKFGKPLTPATPLTIQIVVSKASEDVKPTVAGGKPVEVLEFYAMVGTINENDEITWNGHAFRTTCVWPFGFGGFSQFVSCKAEREVDL